MYPNTIYILGTNNSSKRCRKADWGRDKINIYSYYIIMTTKPTENLVINGIEYTPVSNVKTPASQKKNMKYVIVRTYSS